MRFTSLSISIHIIDKERRKYSAHFMMWLNSYVRDQADYGHQLAHLRQEVNEAFAQIENALEVASETQRVQLEKFRSDLQAIVDEVNENE
ncbi:hypothetical protein [Geobacillus stearothermophilus]|uniref:hypothetical protein n=2 Tax=Geobacillus stearothermophilus TaxID=1422 RepID=UPI002E1DC6BA|nr:hypothetical protein [Geobacillus stearothermophilus]